MNFVFFNLQYGFLNQNKTKYVQYYNFINFNFLDCLLILFTLPPFLDTPPPPPPKRKRKRTKLWTTKENFSKEMGIIWSFDFQCHFQFFFSNFSGFFVCNIYVGSGGMWLSFNFFPTRQQWHPVLCITDAIYLFFYLWRGSLDSLMLYTNIIIQ